jgi:hypothetical protein
MHMPLGVALKDPAGGGRTLSMRRSVPTKRASRGKGGWLVAHLHTTQVRR